jgi:hypothetical protein
MIPRFAPLLFSFVLMTFSLFAQEDSVKLIPLHLPDNTNLVHFEENGYILSFDRDELLAGIETGCAPFPAIGDTLDVRTFDKLLWTDCKYSEGPGPFRKNLKSCLLNGTVKVHSLVSGKDLTQLRSYAEKMHPVEERNCTLYLEDPTSGAEIYSVLGFKTITMPNF